MMKLTIWDYSAFDRAEIVAYKATLQIEMDRLQAHLDSTCGAHPTLVALKTEGFEEGEDEYGWHFADPPEISLLQKARGNKEWLLEITCRYEHDDDRGGQFEACGQFSIRDGQFGVHEELPFVSQGLAPADDVEACGKALAKYFETEGPG